MPVHRGKSKIFRDELRKIRRFSESFAVASQKGDVGRMKEFLRRIKADFLLSSVLCILLGVVFIIWNNGVLNVIGSVLAIGMIVIGVVYLGSFFLSIVTNGLSVVMGILVLAVGIWFLADPAVIMSLIPIVIGVVLLFHGIRGIKETIEAKKYGFDAWGANLILAIISVILGFFCVFDAFGMVEKATIVVGIILIYNGVSNIWIAGTATHAAKDYARRNGTVDVNFVEDGDNDETDGI